MPTLTDVFAPDAFSVYELTAAIQKIPYAPNSINASGLFRAIPIKTTTAVIEEQNGTLALIPTSQRGGPGTPGADPKRKVTNLTVPHIQVDDSVMADDALNTRAFGSNEVMSGVSEIVARKLQTASQSIDATQEYLKMGALNGVVAYPTDSVTADLNLFTEFGATEVEVDFLLTTPATAVLESIIPSVQRAMQTALGGTPFSGINALCGTAFFESLISHAEVQEAYRDQQALLATAAAVAPVRPGGPQRKVFLGGIWFEEYYGDVSATDFLDTDTARFYPTGTDIFHTYLAPADFTEAAGTLGQPKYARQYAAPDGKSVVLETQVNPLSICTRPGALIKGNRIS